MNIDFSDNLDAAAKIADRASVAFITHAGGRMAFIMDLLAADGVNGNDPIDLDAMAVADDFNFAHDAYGITAHMDRATGRLTGCFVPRFTRHVPAGAQA